MAFFINIVVVKDKIVIILITFALVELEDGETRQPHRNHLNTQLFSNKLY